MQRFMNLIGKGREINGVFNVGTVPTKRTDRETPSKIDLEPIALLLKKINI